MPFKGAVSLSLERPVGKYPEHILDEYVDVVSVGQSVCVQGHVHFVHV